MQLIDARQAPELLINGEVETEERVARQRTPTVPMPMYRHLAVAAQMLDARKPDAIDADHYAGPAQRNDGIMPPAHLVDAAGNVDRVHRHAPQAIRMPMQDRHDRPQSPLERRVRGISQKFVVLDEVDFGSAQRIDQPGGLLRRQADAGLDDAADHRPPEDARFLARARNAELRSGESRRVVGREVDIEQAQPGHFAELEQVAGKRCHQRR